MHGPTNIKHVQYSYKKLTTDNTIIASINYKKNMSVNLSHDIDGLYCIVDIEIFRFLSMWALWWPIQAEISS
jgi:hypothetical protein